MDCKQRNSTVSKEAPTVSEKPSPLFISPFAWNSKILRAVSFCRGEEHPINLGEEKGGRHKGGSPIYEKCIFEIRFIIDSVRSGFQAMAMQLENQQLQLSSSMMTSGAVFWQSICEQGESLRDMLLSVSASKPWGSPKPIHLKPGHLKMAFFSARCRLDGAIFV